MSRCERARVHWSMRYALSGLARARRIPRPGVDLLRTDATTHSGAKFRFGAVATDAARTLACAFVVVSHVNANIKEGFATWWPLGSASAILFTMAVPTFFLLSGYSAPVIF